MKINEKTMEIDEKSKKSNMFFNDIGLLGAVWRHLGGLLGRLGGFLGHLGGLLGAILGQLWPSWRQCGNIMGQAILAVLGRSGGRLGAILGRNPTGRRKLCAAGRAR